MQSQTHDHRYARWQYGRRWRPRWIQRKCIANRRAGIPGRCGGMICLCLRRCCLSDLFLENHWATLFSTKGAKEGTKDTEARCWQGNMPNLLSIKPRQHLGFVFFVLYLVSFVFKVVSLYVFLEDLYQLMLDKKELWQSYAFCIVRNGAFRYCLHPILYCFKSRKPGYLQPTYSLPGW